MNIQLNLLPEARLQKIKNQAKKRRYGAIAGLVVGTTVASIVMFLLLQGFLIGTYQVGQNKIKDLKSSLASTADLEEKATTLQNNLAAFSTANANRTNASKIFTNLFNATPSAITIIGAVPVLKRELTYSQTLSTENLTSGIKMQAASPARPE